MPEIEAKTGNEAETAFRAMIRVYGLIGRIMQPYFGRMGISGSQWGALRVLYRAEQEGLLGLKMLELGERLLVRPPSVSGLVTRLQRLGYVRRLLPKTDLRVKEVRLTTAGRELVRQVLRSHGNQIELLMGGLDGTELQQLQGFMDRLSDHLERIAATAEPVAHSGMTPGQNAGDVDLPTGSCPE